jgi:hypothetical protein
MSDDPISNEEALMVALIRLIHGAHKVNVYPYYSPHTPTNTKWEVEATTEDGSMWKITTNHRSKADAMVAALSPTNTNT